MRAANTSRVAPSYLRTKLVMASAEAYRRTVVRTLLIIMAITSSKIVLR